MRIAVASLGKDENSEVSERAGRAPFYLIFNERGKLLEAVSNPFAMGGGGAGFAVAKMLADKAVTVVVAGRFGPNMISAMKERGLKYYEMKGKIGEAILRFLGNKE
jgi:predicted Fe-Mo cluster-binding NifX family protein